MKVDKLRTVIIYIIIILLGLVCLLPLLNIVAISFSSSAAVVTLSYHKWWNHSDYISSC